MQIVINLKEGKIKETWTETYDRFTGVAGVYKEVTETLSYTKNIPDIHSRINNGNLSSLARWYRKNGNIVTIIK